MPFDGGTILVNPAESLGRDIAYRLGNFETFEMELFKSMLQPGDTVLDIGANIGLYTMSVARRLTTGALHAFEANPQIFSILTQNIAPYHPHIVTAHPIALGAQTGTVAFYCATDSAFSGVVDTGRSPITKAIQIPLTTVDEFVSQWSINRVDLIKLDVEGYEPEVLQGAAGVLRGKDAPILMLEIAKPNLQPRGLSQIGVIETLEQMGYVVLVAEPGLAAVRDLDWTSGWQTHENFLAVKPAHAARLKAWRV